MKLAELKKLIFDPTTCVAKKNTGWLEEEENSGSIDNEKLDLERLANEDIDECKDTICDWLHEYKGKYEFVFFFFFCKTKIRPGVYFPHVIHSCDSETLVEIENPKLLSYFRPNTPSAQLLKRLLKK